MQKVDLNDEIIRGMPYAAPGQHQEFADETIDNMRIVVAGTRKAFYYVPSFMQDGHVHWRLGWFPSMNTEDAREIANRLNRTTASFAPDGAGATTWTFADVAEAYLEWLPSRDRNRSTGSEIKFFRRHILDPAVNRWRDKPIGAVIDDDVATLVYAIRSRGAKTTARNCLAKMRTMFRWAMRPDRRQQFGLRHNPVDNLTPRLLDLKPRPRLRWHLSIRELQAYLTVIDDLPNRRDRALAWMLALTGARLVELTAARWSDIDLDRKLWARRSYLSDQISRTPISSAVAALLADLRETFAPEPDDFVFGAEAGKRVPKDRSRMKALVGRRMEEWLVSDGSRPLEPWTWCDMRRTVRIILANLGLDFGPNRSVFGRNGISLAYYGESKLRAALDLLAEELDAVRSGARTDDILS
ncbi:tyrosine-type recombinase/integrase [Rhizobium leguminosarum]